MKFKLSVMLAALASAASLCALPASADDEVWNNSARIGLYSVFYHTSATDLAGPYVPEGVNFKAKDLETLYLGYVRTLPYNLSVELALGYPPPQQGARPRPRHRGIGALQRRGGFLGPAGCRQQCSLNTTFCR